MQRWQKPFFGLLATHRLLKRLLSTFPELTIPWHLNTWSFFLDIHQSFPAHVAPKLHIYKPGSSISIPLMDCRINDPHHLLHLKNIGLWIGNNGFLLYTHVSWQLLLMCSLQTEISHQVLIPASLIQCYWHYLPSTVQKLSFSISPGTK